MLIYVLISIFFEIQTAQFNMLKEKLNLYIKFDYRVTIVYPLIKRKNLIWIDQHSGGVVSSRKVSRKGNIYNIILILFENIKKLNRTREKEGFRYFINKSNEYDYLVFDD